MATIDIVLKPAITPDLVATASDLFREYAEFIDTDLEYQGFSAELASLPGPYTPPRGGLYLAYAEAEIAGCVAFRALDYRVAEMKRLYVASRYQGRGLGKQLVTTVIRAARDIGYAELRLDTLPSMEAAQGLYRRLGFIEIPPYSTAHPRGTRFYALKLNLIE